MPVPEPTGELYQAVKQVADSWPPDSEDVATALAQTLHQSGDTAAQAATRMTALATTVHGAWRDSAGLDMAGKVRTTASRLTEVARGADQQSALAQDYAHTLTATKTVISRVVAQHEPLYQRLSLPPLVPLQRELVVSLAQQFQQLVASGGSTPGQADPGLFGGIGKAIQDQWNNSPLGQLAKHDTVGVCVGVSGGVLGGSLAGSRCLIHAPDGKWAVTTTGTIGFGPSKDGVKAGGFLGAGVLVSDGQTVDAQAGKTTHADATVGDEFTVNGSYDTDGTTHTWVGSAGVGGGIALNSGRSKTEVLPLDTPENWIKALGGR